MASEILEPSGTNIKPEVGHHPETGPRPGLEFEAENVVAVRDRSAAKKITFKERYKHGVNWGTTLWLTAMHIGAVAAIWHFSYAGLITLFVMHFVTACLGITLGYHRMLTHGSFIVPNPLKYFFSICGILATEGSPLYWIATHRKHHAHSDQDDDPHSPLHGFLWGHMIWLVPGHTKEDEKALFERWAPDLLKDPVQRFFHKWFFITPFLQGFALYAIGEYALGGIGISMVLWGLCLRMVFAYHSTWFVNSATHTWGYRNYETRDWSTNLWWVAMLSYGEGWHNNHHAHQRLARHGHKWGELDITYAVIWTLKKLGLATKVQDNIPKS